MRYSGRHVASVALVVAGVFALPALIAALNSRLATAQDATTSRQPEKCPGDNGGLTLSPGFCASIFADNLGHVRHMVVASDGTVYANTWSGRYFPNSPPPPGGFLLPLKDTKGMGRADVVERFCAPPSQGVGTEAAGSAFTRGGSMPRNPIASCVMSSPPDRCLPRVRPRLWCLGCH